MKRAAPFVLVTAVSALGACSDPKSPSVITETPSTLEVAAADVGGFFNGRPSITPVTGDDACYDQGSTIVDPTDQPFQLPLGFSQSVVTYQGDFATTSAEVNFDMLTLNERGSFAGRFLYRTHEVSPYAGLSVFDLHTRTSTMVAERQDWESFDGLVWTPWNTILMAEEEIVQAFRDPDYPNIERGLIYEYNPVTKAVDARPAVGARSHEGLRFDRSGNLYGISESRGIANAGQPGESGALFKFVPTRRGDLTSGTLYALKVRSGMTGAADWVRLTLDPVTFDSDAAAQAVGATGWDRPEDIEIVRQGNREVLYVAVTESSNLPQNNGLVLKIVLSGNEAIVSNYVEPGVNVSPEIADAFKTDAGTGFDDPDNLTAGPNGALYISEDDGPSDIWVAYGNGSVASTVEVFARLLDCGAESTGIYWDTFRKLLWVNSQHAALNGGRDLTIAIKDERQLP